MTNSKTIHFSGAFRRATRSDRRERETLRQEHEVRLEPAGPGERPALRELRPDQTFGATIIEQLGGVTRLAERALGSPLHPQCVTAADYQNSQYQNSQHRTQDSIPLKGRFVLN